MLEDLPKWTREGHGHSDSYWNYFNKGDIRETSERQGRAPEWAFLSAQIPS